VGSGTGFEALGYYERTISHEETGAPLRIKVRRFDSLGCEVTISCLPEFCQPYRIVCNAAITGYFRGHREHRRTARWLEVLATYRRRFEHWMKGKVPGMGAGLLATVGARFGRPPPPEEPPVKFWRQVLEACGGLDSATRRLVREFRITLFGCYKCHQPRQVASGK